MAKSLNRYFQFLDSSGEAQPSGRLWYPAADIYKTPDGWLVKVELAGVSADDIEIEVRDNQLHIIGSRKDKTCAAGGSVQQLEITYSRFEKALEFPGSIEKAKLEHNFEDGLLMIFLKTS